MFSPQNVNSPERYTFKKKLNFSLKLSENFRNLRL